MSQRESSQIPELLQLSPASPLNVLGSPLFAPGPATTTKAPRESTFSPRAEKRSTGEPQEELGGGACKYEETEDYLRGYQAALDEMRNFTSASNNRSSSPKRRSQASATHHSVPFHSEFRRRNNYFQNENTEQCDADHETSSTSSAIFSHDNESEDHEPPSYTSRSDSRCSDHIKWDNRPHSIRRRRYSQSPHPSHKPSARGNHARDHTPSTKSFLSWQSFLKQIYREGRMERIADELEVPDGQDLDTDINIPEKSCWTGPGICYNQPTGRTELLDRTTYSSSPTQISDVLQEDKDNYTRSLLRLLEHGEEGWKEIEEWYTTVLGVHPRRRPLLFQAIYPVEHAFSSRNDSPVLYGCDHEARDRFNDARAKSAWADTKRNGSKKERLRW
ncbi:uncharacterized protein RCO7_02861 [Rhynchosporium graminicola]|uniref:Uncharacterized protein n=1 Tax=Rhynchosporium graminicola TaxID=2792576 RepID=A0A1E1KSD4_9HELO|nr:uncharacterized protein RCO7_02861 [Rhynchosporium commune]